MFNQVSSDIGLKVLMAKSEQAVLALVAERDELCEFVTRTSRSIAKCYNARGFHVSAETNYEIREIMFNNASEASTSRAGSSRADTETNDGTDTDYETDSD